MKFRLLLSVAMVSLSVSQGLAQEIKAEPELVRQMLQDGWTKVAEGVLQRNDGTVETFTYGEEGLRWTARRLEARLESLQKEYEGQPTEKLAGIIQSLESQLIETDQTLKSGAAANEVVSPDELANCTISYWATAAADPETGSQGVKANATAYFHANCGQIGNSYAYAYGRATAGTVTTTKTQEDPKYNSTWVDSAASVSVPGSSDCYSEAYGRTWSPQLNINYEVSDTNFSCPAPVERIAASISGPYEVYLDDSSLCKIVTWYASATGGTPGYTYQWYLGTGTTVVGTASSYSKKVCSSNQRIDVKVVVTDSGYPAQFAEATFSTWVYYENSCSSNCTCYDNDPYSPYDPPPVC